MAEQKDATVPALLRAVLEKGNAYNANNRVSQKELYQAARDLAEVLQPPFEKVAELAMYQVSSNPNTMRYIRYSLE